MFSFRAKDMKETCLLCLSMHDGVTAKPDLCGRNVGMVDTAEAAGSCDIGSRKGKGPTKWEGSHEPAASAAVLSDYFTRSPYERSVVFTRILSPMLMKRGAMMIAPVSRVTSFCALVEAVSPFTAGSV